MGPFNVFTDRKKRINEQKKANDQKKLKKNVDAGNISFIDSCNVLFVTISVQFGCAY